MDDVKTKEIKLFLLLFCLSLSDGSNDGLNSNFPNSSPLQNLPEVRMQQLTSEMFKMKDSLENLGDKENLFIYINKC